VNNSIFASTGSFWARGGRRNRQSERDMIFAILVSINVSRRMNLRLAFTLPATEAG